MRGRNRWRGKEGICSIDLSKRNRMEHGFGCFYGELEERGRRKSSGLVHVIESFNDRS